jgi:DNA-directed RNA polymerase II subunit RPB2
MVKASSSRQGRSLAASSGAIPPSSKGRKSKAEFTSRDAVPLCDLLLNGPRDGHRYLVRHQLDSVNQLMEERLPQLLAERQVFHEKLTRDKKYVNYLMFKDNAYVPPMLDDEPLMPQEAIKLGLTYSVKVLSHVEQWQDVVDIATNRLIDSRKVGEEDSHMNIANLPIMVSTNLCNRIRHPTSEKLRDESPWNYGGYYIVNGNEKGLVTVETGRENRILTYPKKDGGEKIFASQVSSRNLALADGITQMVSVTMKKNNELILRMPKFNEFSIFTLFRGWGYTDRDIQDLCITDPSDKEMVKQLRICMEKSRSSAKRQIFTQEDALNALADKLTASKRLTDSDRDLRNQQRRLQVMRHLQNMIPHVTGGYLKKALYLGLMINKLLAVKLGRIPPDDRDSFVNKNFESSGKLIEQKIRESLHKLLKECERSFNSRNTDIAKPILIIDVIRPTLIEQGVRQALTTGSWGKKKKGIAQVLGRLSFLQTLSHLRRLVSPTVDSSTNKLTSPRHYHNTQAFYACCTTGDTLVTLEDGSQKRMDRITEQDRVLTVEPRTGKTEPSGIHSIFRKELERVVRIRTADKRELVCTEDHPLLVRNMAYRDGWQDWKFAHDVVKGDQVATYDSKTGEINYVDILSAKRRPATAVYDFTTDHDNHSFIANGIVTHNCVESPDGHKIGLVKNLALSTTLTTAKLYLVPTIKSLIREYGGGVSFENATQEQRAKWTLISVNGTPFKYHDKPSHVEALLRTERMGGGKLEWDVGISHNRRGRELHISCDEGRPIRPVLKVDPKTNKLGVNREMMDEVARDISDCEQGKIASFSEFQQRHNGVVDWLDAEEATYSMIAMFPEDVEENHRRMKETEFSEVDRKRAKVNRIDKYNYVSYTHCELHPLFAIGVVTCNTPLFDHNQAPRNIFQYGYARQSIGIFISNWRKRMDISYLLHYPERSLVSTYGQYWTGVDMEPAGANCIVAIMTRKGYNVEDSLETNQDAFDRGLHSAVSFKKVTSEQKKNASVSRDDEFMKPVESEVAEMGAHNYDKINMDGYVPRGTEVVNGDAIIGKATPVAEREGGDHRRYRDASEIFKSNVPAYVDDVWPDLMTNEGYKLYKMRLRLDREIVEGDKMGSRHGFLAIEHRYVTVC